MKSHLELSCKDDEQTIYHMRLEDECTYTPKWKTK